jgi:hypothetical protein
MSAHVPKVYIIESKWKGPMGNRWDAHKGITLWTQADAMTELLRMRRVLPTYQGIPVVYRVAIYTRAEVVDEKATLRHGLPVSKVKR